MIKKLFFGREIILELFFCWPKFKSQILYKLCIILVLEPRRAGSDIPYDLLRGQVVAKMGNTLPRTSP